MQIRTKIDSASLPKGLIIRKMVVLMLDEKWLEELIKIFIWLVQYATGNDLRSAAAGASLIYREVATKFFFLNHD